MQAFSVALRCCPLSYSSSAATEKGYCCCSLTLEWGRRKATPLLHVDQFTLSVHYVGHECECDIVFAPRQGRYECVVEEASSSHGMCAERDEGRAIRDASTSSHVLGRRCWQNRGQNLEFGEGARCRATIPFSPSFAPFVGRTPARHPSSLSVRVPKRTRRKQWIEYQKRDGLTPTGMENVQARAGSNSARRSAVRNERVSCGCVCTFCCLTLFVHTLFWSRFSLLTLAIKPAARSCV